MTNRNEQKESLSLEEQIRLKMREVKIQREAERERKLAEEKKLKENPLKKGRPKLDKETIQKAWKLAETNSLPDVALKLDISLQSLYNYGINRKAVDERMELRETFEPTLELIKAFFYLLNKVSETLADRNKQQNF
jgi:hypothetical protein